MNRLCQMVGLVFLCGFAVLVAAPAPHASAWSEQEYRFLSHGWVEKYGQHLIVIDEWEPHFGVDRRGTAKENHQGRMGVGPAQQGRSHRVREGSRRVTPGAGLLRHVALRGALRLGVIALLGVAVTDVGEHSRADHP